MARSFGLRAYLTGPQRLGHRTDMALGVAPADRVAQFPSFPDDERRLYVILTRPVRGN